MKIRRDANKSKKARLQSSQYSRDSANVPAEIQIPDESTVFCTPETAVPKKKCANKESAPIEHCSTSAFQSIAPCPTLVEGVKSFAEQNAHQESQYEVGVIKPQIAPVFQT